MRKTIAITAVLFFSVVLLSCSKSSNESFNRPESSARIINAKIAAGQAYILDLETTGELSITRQALHYKVSETGRNEKNGYLNYKYIPAAGFKGVEEVVLSHTSEFTGYNAGNGCNYGDSFKSTRTTSIALKITVAD